MRIILSSFVLAIIFAIILTGCGSIESEFPTTETGFPIGFVRESDGAQIRSGMSRDSIDEILQRVNPRTGEIWESSASGPMAFYNDIENFIVIHYIYDRVRTIAIAAEEWAISEGFSVGDNIQSVIDSNNFQHLTHDAESREVVIDDDLENVSFRIMFRYDYGIISAMILTGVG